MKEVSIIVAGAPDYQFLKDFIDTGVGILFILFLLKITFSCVKYVLRPFISLFYGILTARTHVKDMCRNYVETHERNYTNSPVETRCQNESCNCNTDFNKRTT